MAEKPKRHNWVRKVSVDLEVDRAAFAAVCGCNFFTPAAQERMDRQLDKQFPLTAQERGDVEQMLRMSEQKAKEVVEEEEEDWQNQEPSRDDLDEIEMERGSKERLASCE